MRQREAGAKERGTLSPTRTKATWKPGVSDDALPVFRCAACGSVVFGADGPEGPRLSGGPRRPEATLPYAANAFAPACCGAAMDRLAPTAAENAACALSYDVVGGFDANALRVFWECADKTSPRWIALKTFTGMQLKYVLPGKRPPLVFALADEDAYAYCDEDPCIGCTFHCKRGFAIYACLEDGTLIEKPVHCERLTR